MLQSSAEDSFACDGGVGEVKYESMEQTVEEVSHSMECFSHSDPSTRNDEQAKLPVHGALLLALCVCEMSQYSRGYPNRLFQFLLERLAYSSGFTRDVLLINFYTVSPTWHLCHSRILTF